MIIPILLPARPHRLTSQREPGARHAGEECSFDEGFDEEDEDEAHQQRSRALMASWQTLKAEGGRAGPSGSGPTKAKAADRWKGKGAQQLEQVRESEGHHP
jgi:hypothetical protein